MGSNLVYQRYRRVLIQIKSSVKRNNSEKECFISTKFQGEEINVVIFINDKKVNIATSRNETQSLAELQSVSMVTCIPPPAPHPTGCLVIIAMIRLQSPYFTLYFYAIYYYII